MLQSRGVEVLQSRGVAELHCCRVKVLQCCSVAELQCCRVEVLQRGLAGGLQSRSTVVCVPRCNGLQCPLASGYRYI